MADDQLAENIISEGTKLMHDIIPKMCQKWKDIGYNEETRKKYGETVLSHQQALLEEMLSELNEREKSLIERIASMKKEIQVLSNNLSTSADMNHVGSLLEVTRSLQDSLEELRAVKESRMHQYKDLYDKELEICSVMGVEPVGLDSTIPSEEELNNYESYVLSRENELLRLKNLFKDTRMKIMKGMDELGYSLRFEFERLVISDHQNFIFSSENMKKLENLYDEIREMLKAAKENAEKKRQELKTLLDYLEITSDYEDFFSKNSGCDSSTISMLNREIKKYKEIRMKNIQKFVEKVREEIKQWWDLCKFSEEQRNKFHAFNYETITEDVLTIHELEVEKLKEFYRENEKIFHLFYEHQEMLQKMKELDLRADDPNRLNNRGGQLLEEEKSRKQLAKNLPKVLGKLKELLVIFEAKKGIIFTFDGVSHEEFVQRQMDEFNMEKENLKIARAKAKDEKRSGKKTPLSASRRNLAISSRTLCTSVKRKLPMEKSPGFGSHKKRLVQSEKRPTACGSKIRRSGRVSRRILGSSFTKTTPKKSGKIPKITLTAAEGDSTLNLQQYEEFQEHLAERNELRSTLLSEQVLKNARIDENKKMKTPIKTPVKPLRKHLIGPGTPHVTPKSGIARRPSRSPRITSTPRLTAAPSNGLSNLKL